MRKIVVLSGAGVSAESGIPTFRDAGGLWEGYDVMEVASPEGWQKNPEVVLEFYNQRRKKAIEVKPNEGHRILAELEEHFEVSIVTQNIDNLHERAGSSKVLHLHGELFKSRSTQDESLIYDIEGWELKMGDKCEKGAQLRPHVVWFGEAVPMFEVAIQEVETADILIVVGTSLQVYPAASLINYTRQKTPTFIVDPNTKGLYLHAFEHYTFIDKGGSDGLKEVKEILMKEYVAK